VWPVEVADVRKELCSSSSGAFLNPRVFEDATAALKTFRALNLGEGNDRPTKRRKALPESAEDVNDSTYKQLAVTLNGNTRESPMQNLSNIHNIIQ
jgi:serine/threonine-protein kinase ATR